MKNQKKEWLEKIKNLEDSIAVKENDHKAEIEILKKNEEQATINLKNMESRLANEQQKQEQTNSQLKFYQDENLALKFKSIEFEKSLNEVQVKNETLQKKIDSLTLKIVDLSKPKKILNENQNVDHLNENVTPKAPERNKNKQNEVSAFKYFFFILKIIKFCQLVAFFKN